MKKPYEDKPGNSFERFEKAVKKILSTPKEEIDKREAEYQRTKKTTATKKRGQLNELIQ